MRTQFGVHCVENGPETCSGEDKAKIEEFRTKFLGITHKIKRNKPAWGFWLRSCFEHVYQGSWAWYGETKNVFNKYLGISINLKDALHKWYNHGKIMHSESTYSADQKDWEHNSYCK